MEIVLSAATFAGTVAVIMALGLAAKKRFGVGTRLKELVSAREKAGRPAPAPASGRTDIMPTVTNVLSGHRLAERLSMELSAAGLPIRPSEFVGIVAGSVLIFQIPAVLILRGIVSYMLFGLVGASLPVLVLKVLQRRRQAAFSAQIVDALTMIASSLHSGFSLLRAMQMIAQEMPPPISQEFERVISEVNVGRSLESALRKVVARAKSYDFDLAVTAISIQHQVGGNLADIFETIAATIRERTRIIGEIRALTAEGRISGIILMMLPVGLSFLLALLNPSYIAVLFRETMGHYLIGIAVVFQVVGCLVIRNMLRMDV